MTFRACRIRRRGIFATIVYDGMGHLYSGSMTSPHAGSIVGCTSGRCNPTRPSVQRAGGDPARAYAGHEGSLQHDPSPQLCGTPRQLSGLGFGLSLRRRRGAHVADDSAIDRPYPCRRSAPAHPVCWRVRCVLRSHMAVAPRDLLGRARSQGRRHHPRPRGFLRARGARRTTPWTTVCGANPMIASNQRTAHTGKAGTASALRIRGAIGRPRTRGMPP
jgi:hypothetical protein